MRWRFVDRIVRVEPWAAIETHKSVSFEEYSLLKPLGRKGWFPESLVVECCVEAARWLVAASSDFQQVGVLSELTDFRFQRAIGMGERLEITASVGRRAPTELALACRVMNAGEPVASGLIGVRIVPLAEGFEPEIVESMWRELYGTA